MKQSKQHLFSSFSFFSSSCSSFFSFFLSFFFFFLSFFLSSMFVPIKQFGSRGEGKGQFNYPYGICYDEKINILLFLISTIIWFKTGSKNGQFQYPCQLSIEPLTNHILVADLNNNRIQIFNDKGQFISVFGQDILQYPHAVSCSQIHPFILLLLIIIIKFIYSLLLLLSIIT